MAFNKSYQIEESDIDLHKLEEYQELFKRLDPISQSSLLVIDYYHSKYFYISEKVKIKLGLDSDSTDAVAKKIRIHPDDHLIIDSLDRAIKYICSQAIDERKKYRLVNNFRVCNESKQYVRIFVQHSILEMDKRGNIWLGLRKIDYDPDQGMDKPAVSFLQHVETNEIVYTIYGDTESGLISKREREVLKLISDGYASKQIADRLFISENTVNNHRKNILRKLHASNTFEAIHKAVRARIIK
ncbi:response regulator transcription factor [Marinifilum sp.]|uniref:response regulator transcription factor n=1 Tax=Marinifilum sp. TaxID=2033137 RepID=UPI003BAC4F10